MKRIWILILITSYSLSSYAQKQKVENLPKHDVDRVFKFGFTLAANTTSFRVKKNSDINLYPDIASVEVLKQAGFLLGILSNMRINDWYDLRFMPAISFSERVLEYKVRSGVTGSSIEQVDRRIESTFLEFPVLLKYKSNRLNNMRMYMIGGGKYTLDLASQIKIDNEI